MLEFVRLPACTRDVGQLRGRVGCGHGGPIEIADRTVEEIERGGDGGDAFAENIDRLLMESRIVSDTEPTPGDGDVVTLASMIAHRMADTDESTASSASMES